MSGEEDQSVFSDEELAIIASVPSKPAQVPNATPLSKSFIDKMTSSVADPGEARAEAQSARQQWRDEIIIRG